MPKVKNKKPQKKNEFRKNKKSGHPAYIYELQGNSFKFLGITHSKITKGVKNIELEKNPNPKDKKKSFVKPTPEKLPVNKFGKKEKSWKLSKTDKSKIKKLMK